MLSYRTMKRLIDIVISFLLLPLLVLLFIPVAILIKVDDGGAIFYKAKRRGLKGQPFYMYKFRSMKENAPDLRNSDNSTFNAENDPRVTRVGRMLRKLSIDEIPQLLNVLLGDMSIIGPRPNMATKSFEELSEKEIRRLDVKPGITGLSQAYYRNSISMDKKMDYDIYYSQHYSFWLDVKIFFKTISSVLKKENINGG